MRGFQSLKPGALSTAFASIFCCAVAVDSLAETISVGESHAAAVLNDGSVVAWGSNFSGKLGNGSTINSSIPTPVAGLGNVVSISAGGNHTLALDTNRLVWAWGNNQFGQLGTLFGDNAATPARVVWQTECALNDVISIGTGYDFSVALKADGTVCTWGKNELGQLGDGSSATMRSNPGKVSNLSDVTAISVGNDFVAALKRDGTVWVWGNNAAGQLAVNTKPFRNMAGRLAGLANITSISAGVCGGIALDTSGVAWAWGAPGGSLDCLVNEFLDLWPPTRLLSGLDQITNVASGAKNLATRKDGSVWEHDGYVWTQVNDISTVQRLASAAKGFVLRGVNLAQRADGTVWSWGDNFSGELGDGTFVAHQTPILVVNTAGDGPLDLNSAIANNIPASKIPKFFVTASGGIPKPSGSTTATNTIASVTATVKFNQQDTGNPGGVFVTAIVPVGTLVTRGGTHRQPDPRSNTPRNAATSDYVLVQLTATGWQAVTNGQLIPLAIGILGEQLATHTILDRTNTANLQGTEFCIGYGASAPDMATTARMRSVATIPNDKNSINVSCTTATISTVMEPVNCLFNWAEVNFSDWFSPRAESLSSGQYFFRYFSQTKAYLAVASERFLYLGPASGDSILDLGVTTDWFSTAGCL
jgi:alpha-tubulin suppressor-like RCC1 family protein